MTQAPGSSRRLPMKPLTGEVMVRVGEVDLQLVEPRLGLCELRLGEIELRRRRLIACVGVVEGLLRNQLPLEEIARAIEVGLGQAQIGLALADGRRRDLEGRLRLLDLFEQLAVFDLRQLLAAATPGRRAARAPPRAGPLTFGYGFDRGGADQVADDRELGATCRRA